MRAAPLTYAVGDIHGCLGLLRQALSRIEAHARGRDHTVVLLGDYVDRGPDAKGVLDLLMNLRGTMSLVCLRGNHEEMMVQAYSARSQKSVDRWRSVGGDATLRSYSAAGRPLCLGDVPETHWVWLASRPLVLEDAGHIFVHAGIDPRSSVTEQGASQFLWIRDRFLSAAADEFCDRRHVIHGHTPQWRDKPEAAVPELLMHRTNLDTGAYMTGVLSVGVFDVERSRGPIDLISVY